MNIRQKNFLIVMLAVPLMLASCTSPTQEQTSSPVSTNMAGYWLDDNKMVTTIIADGDGFAVDRVDYTLASTIQEYLTASSYENGVLTWSYWAPTKPGITTMQTVSFNGDTLVVEWTNDRGTSGQMTLTRIATPPYDPE